MSENHTVNKCFSKKVNLLYQELCDCGSSDACYTRPCLTGGKEMVKDVITVIHDCLKKTHVIFITDFIERGLVRWEDNPV